MTSEMLAPLIVVVTGSCDDEVLRTVPILQSALPEATVRNHVRAGASLAEVSASAQFVVHVGVQNGLGDPEFVDATLSSDADLRDVVRRVRDVDRRRLAHELPPDLPPSLEPWSASWEPAARRVGARLINVLERCGVTGSVDHIGSTSVPGLPAKDIIDLQVSVASLEAFDGADSALRSAGFVNVQQIAPGAPGVRSDNPRGNVTASEQWEKRLYAGVDATQRTIVHVRQVGAANWRYALLFRDWLRSNNDQRDAYAEVKASLAAAHSEDTNFDDYARAKDFWFDGAFEKSEAWAQRTSWQPR